MQIMRRLYQILKPMKNSECAYTQMYNGPMVIHEVSGSVDADDNVYFEDSVSYEISQTSKHKQDLPTVTIAMPLDELIKERENIELKRLKYYLLKMTNNESTYSEIYNGKMQVLKGDCAKAIKENGDTDEQEDVKLEFTEVRDNTYFLEKDAASFDIELSGKLQKDKPTITYKIPLEKLKFEDCSVAAADYCLRAFAPYADEINEILYNRSRPDNENGKIYVDKPSSKVILRNTAFFAYCPQRGYEYLGGIQVRRKEACEGPLPNKLCLCIRLQVQLPKGNIKRTQTILLNYLPQMVNKFIAEFDCDKLTKAIQLADVQANLRAWLKESEYCAFIANGSILPRSKGTDLPMEGAIPFVSTPDDEIEVMGIKGMGIKKGVTVITGGGYSGKSTVLNAIAEGIYDHVLGDGRELCITDDTAMTISAEDGRSVKNVNVSPFIKWLPNCGDTMHFYTDHASGSTSQAANIMEAIEYGSHLLLIDEDRSATNFMIRDAVMKELIEKEPITPFTDRVRELGRDLGVSTILVIGGSGEYLSVADKVYMMDDYVIKDVTQKANEICNPDVSCPPQVLWAQSKKLKRDGFDSHPNGAGSEVLEVSDMGFIIVGSEKINVTGLHDIVCAGQLYALGFILRKLMITQSPEAEYVDVNSAIDQLYETIYKDGLDTVWSGFFNNCERFLALPRKCELKAVINRMRGVTIC